MTDKSQNPDLQDPGKLTQETVDHAQRLHEAETGADANWDTMAPDDASRDESIEPAAVIDGTPVGEGPAGRRPTNAELELESQRLEHTEVKRISYAGLIARRFFRQKSAVAGLIILAVLALLAIFGPMISPYDYTDPDFAALSVAPSAEHWFGTDSGGLDLFACVVHGLGRSLVIGISYALITTVLAAVIGTAIAYARGIWEKIGMWCLDMLLVIPSFLLVAMIVRATSGGTGWLMLIFGLSAFGWIGYARTLRTMALSLRERDYVKAAKYMGVSPFTIIVRHLIPNLGSILIIDTVLGVISGINSETAYSFLGLGIKVPDTSLGYILSQGSSAMLTAPWVVLIPSIVLIVLCVSMQLIGDGLRDAFDPYSRAAGNVEEEAEDATPGPEKLAEHDI